jgi:hypothetical protein
MASHSSLTCDFVRLQSAPEVLRVLLQSAPEVLRVQEELVLRAVEPQHVARVRQDSLAQKMMDGKGCRLDLDGVPQLVDVRLRPAAICARGPSSSTYDFVRLQSVPEVLRVLLQPAPEVVCVQKELVLCVVEPQHVAWVHQEPLAQKITDGNGTLS